MRRFLTLFSILVTIRIAARAQQPSRTVWDGVYTPAQAERGRAIYAARCLQCHREDLSAYESVLKGERFMQHWREDSVDSFFQTMKLTMPRGAPGSLSDWMYADLTAYVLQANEFPPGPAELKPDALRDIRVQFRTGPQELPAGALVDVVGCLVEVAPKDWALIHASEPVRTRNPYDSTAEDLKLWGAKPLGARRFGLMDVDSYHPDSQKGHRVEAKGFLIKNPGGDKINLTALQSTAGMCAQ